MNITTKQFQILTDIDLVWNFFTDTYDRYNGGGILREPMKKSL